MNERQDTPSDRQSKSPERSSGLATAIYLVPTPIGNLEDMTHRAQSVMRNASVIACEDTRTSRTLLQHYHITTPLMSYHEHNGQAMRPKILARLAAGESVALISDAGTPLISDPGYKLVREAQQAGYKVVPLPGACAATTALCASGLPTDHFAFLGFLPAKKQARQTLLHALSTFPGTLICYESPRRVVATLHDVQVAMGEREAVLARELSKHYEEIVRLPIAELIDALAAREQLKGEAVLLIGPPREKTADKWLVDSLLRQTLTEYGTKEAARQVAEQTGASKTELYQRALELKDEA